MTDRHRSHNPPLPRRMVLLLHEMDGVGSHFDWMLERVSDDERRLVTFRVAGRVDLLDSGKLESAERLTDHRAAYLEHEGDIGPGRGRVTRVARGLVHSLSIDDQRMLGVISWGDHGEGVRLRIEGDAEPGGRWRICWRMETKSPSGVQRT